jgi:hypothetical protein
MIGAKELNEFANIPYIGSGKAMLLLLPRLSNDTKTYLFL